MEILTWNLDFWRRKNNPVWKQFASDLMRINFDFILLQEINPFFVYGIQYKMQEGSVYSFKSDKKIIYYHELSEVLSKERPNDPFWGTAIITNEKIKMVNNHFYRDNVYIGSKYFG